GRVARMAARTLPRKRRSATEGACPRSASAAPMYSRPSGSTRKKGPRPKRSFPGSGRVRRTLIARPELYSAPESGKSGPPAAAEGGGGCGGTVRGRKKWVSHDLSNAIVYGGLHYGARWLPAPVLNGINLIGNTFAIALLRETQIGIRENFRVALGASPYEAA